MTHTSKLTWGIILIISGGLLFLIGVGLCFSIIGACIGIPMAVVGLPLLIWGVIWRFSGVRGHAEDAIARGVQRGIANAGSAAAKGQSPKSASSGDAQSPQV